MAAKKGNFFSGKSGRRDWDEPENDEYSDYEEEAEQEESRGHRSAFLSSAKHFFSGKSNGDEAESDSDEGKSRFNFRNGKKAEKKDYDFDYDDHETDYASTVRKLDLSEEETLPAGDLSTDEFMTSEASADDFFFDVGEVAAPVDDDAAYYLEGISLNDEESPVEGGAEIALEDIIPDEEQTYDPFANIPLYGMEAAPEEEYSDESGVYEGEYAENSENLYDEGYGDEYAEGEYAEGYEDAYAEGEYAEGYEDAYAEGEYAEGYADEYTEGEYAEGYEDAYADGEYSESYEEGEYYDEDYSEEYDEASDSGYDEDYDDFDGDYAPAPRGLSRFLMPALVGVAACAILAVAFAVVTLIGSPKYDNGNTEEIISFASSETEATETQYTDTELQAMGLATPDPTVETLGIKAKLDDKGRIVPGEGGAVVPARAVKMNYSDFAGSAMIGNSFVSGMKLWSELETIKYICDDGVSLDNMIGNYLYYITVQNYDSIYLCLGLNEIGWSADNFITKYERVIDYIRSDGTSKTKNATIYIISVFPVEEIMETQPAESGSTISKDKILQFNERLKTMCEEKGCWYLDVYSALADDNGYLPASIAADDHVHFEKTGYKVWTNYLQNHYVDEKLLGG